MNKISTLKWSLALMVLLNFCLVAFVFFSKGKKGGPHHPPKERAEKHIQKEFGFDANQMEVFEKSKEKHVEAIRSINDQLRESSKLFYKSEEGKSKDSLRFRVLELSEAVYTANDAHFQELKSICNPDQLSRMDNFIHNLMDNNKGRKKGKPKH